ncbi:MAG: LptF/LptG family permease [Planctomycetia bacterium]|nr:LptF/LptG family permease [Planctomycetia bacterium]
MKSLPFFTTVDRYFMRKYLFVASALLFIAISIYMLFDILPNAEDVSDMFKVSVFGALKTLLQYYSVRMMNLMLYIQVAFIASITAITFFMLEKNSSATVRGGEIIPMLTSGFSRKRVAIPFFIIGSTFIFALCGTEELFYTYCRDWPGANSDSYSGKIEKQEMDMRNDELTGLKIYGASLDLETQSFSNAKIGVPKERTLSQMDEIQAKTARWMAECDEHPSGYMLEEVDKLAQKSWIQTASHTDVALPALGTELPIFYTSETADWVPSGNLFIVASVTPEKLARKKTGYLPASIPELYRAVNESNMLDAHHADRAALHIRILRPVTESLLLFVMIPVILSARLRSKITIFFCLAGLTGLNFALVEIGRLLTLHEGIPASVGAWIPIIVLAGVSAVLFEELYT